MVYYQYFLVSCYNEYSILKYSWYFSLLLGWYYQWCTLCTLLFDSLTFWKIIIGYLLTLKLIKDAPHVPFHLLNKKIACRRYCFQMPPLQQKSTIFLPLFPRVYTCIPVLLFSPVLYMYIMFESVHIIAYGC